MRTAQRRAERWNRKHPPGTPVLFWPLSRAGLGVPTVTRSPATTANQRPVVELSGYGGVYDLGRVKAQAASEHKRDRWNDRCPPNTTVRFWPAGRDGASRLGRTMGGASVEGGRPLVVISGAGSPVPLEDVEVLCG